MDSNHRNEVHRLTLLPSQSFIGTTRRVRVAHLALPRIWAVRRLHYSEATSVGFAARCFRLLRCLLNLMRC